MPKSYYPIVGRWNRDLTITAFNEVLTSNPLLTRDKSINTQTNLSAFLADQAGLRTYTEWCMDASSEGGAKKSESERWDYAGEALDTFLNDEKLWETQDPKRGKNLIKSSYEEEKRILNAFARSACEFFLEHCKRVVSPSKGIDYFKINYEDRTNLRRCLSPWLDDPKYIF